MQTGMFQMSCGNCGGKHFKVYADQNHQPDKFAIECEECKSTTMVEITPPKLNLEWGEGANGILCIMD